MVHMTNHLLPSDHAVRLSPDLFHFLACPAEIARATAFLDSLVAARTCGSRCFLYLEFGSSESSPALVSGTRAARADLEKVVARLVEGDVRNGREPLRGAPPEVAVTFLARSIACRADDLTVEDLTEDERKRSDIYAALLSSFLAQTCPNPVDSPLINRYLEHLARLALWWSRTGGAVAWLD